MSHRKIASMQRWSDIVAYAVVAFCIVYVLYSGSKYFSEYVAGVLRGKGESINFSIAYLSGLFIRGVLIIFDVVRFESVKRDINLHYPSVVFSILAIFLSVSIAEGFVFDLHFWIFLLIFFFGLFYIGLKSLLVVLRFAKDLFVHPAYRAEFNSRTYRCFSHPITDWSMDEYSFKPIVSNMVEFFLRGSERCIGLYGEYGVGKTSAVNLLEHDLKYSGDYIFVRISSWGDSFDSSNARPYVINRIVESLSERVDICYMRHSHSDFSSGISTSFGISLNLSSLFFPKKSPEQWLKNIDDLLLLNDIKIVVVFEDIDRSASPEFVLDNLASFVDFLSFTHNVFFILSLKPTDLFYDRASKICQKSFFIDGYDSIPEFTKLMNNLYIKMNELGIKSFTSDISFSYEQAKVFYSHVRTHFGGVKDFIFLFKRIIKTPRDWRLVRRQIEDDFTLLVGRLTLDEIVVLTVLFHIEKGIKSFFIDNFDIISLAARTRKVDDIDKVKKSWDGCFSNAGSRYDDLYLLLSLYFLNGGSNNYGGLARVQTVVSQVPYQMYYYDVYFKNKLGKYFFEKDIVCLLEYCISGKAREDRHSLLECFVESGFFPKLFTSNQLFEFFNASIQKDKYVDKELAIEIVLEGAFWLLDSRRNDLVHWSNIVRFFDKFRGNQFFAVDRYSTLANTFYSNRIFLEDLASVAHGFYCDFISGPFVLEYYIRLCDEDLDDNLSKQILLVIKNELKNLFYNGFGVVNNYDSRHLSEFEMYLINGSNRVTVFFLHSLFSLINGVQADVHEIYKEYVATMKDRLDGLLLDEEEVPIVKHMRDDALSMACSILNKKPIND